MVHYTRRGGGGTGHTRCGLSIMDAHPVVAWAGRGAADADEA